MRRALLISVAGVAAALASAGSSGATFPGRNGRIVFTKPHAVADAVVHGEIDSFDLVSGRTSNVFRGTPAFGIGRFAVSPDATRVAFVRPSLRPSSVGGGIERDLWLMRVDGSDQRQLAEIDVSGSVVWSPDGSSIAFIGRDPAEPDYYASSSSLWVVNADGSGLRELTDHGAAYPSWSPDGSEIAYVSGASAFGLSRIGLVRATGAGLRWLTGSADCDNSANSSACAITSSPAWSPDGRALVFARGDSLVLIDADGSGERTLTSGVANGPVNCRYGGCDSETASLQWFPRNDEIGFVDKAGNVDLVRPDGSSVQTIVSHASVQTGVVWSPSGDRLAFVRVLVNLHGPALSELVVEPLQGRAQIVTVPSGLALTSMPVWLPSGTGVLYGASGGVHGFELFSMRPGGGDPRQLTHNNLDDFDPGWSPDGRRIAFARGQVDPGYTAAERSLHPTSVAQSSLYVMDADGSHAYRLTRSGIATMPSWSPDGAHIVFARRHGAGLDLDIVDTPTGRVRPLVSNGSDPAWSPDNRLIAFAEANTLQVIRPDGGATRTLFRGGTSETAQILRPAWSPDGRSIAFTLASMRSDGSLAAQRLLTISRLGGAPHTLPCGPFSGRDDSGVDIPRIISRAPNGTIGVSDGGAIWACTPTNASARFLRGGDEPDWQPLH